MYENGSRIKGYYRKRQHRRKLLKQHAKVWGEENWKSLETKWRNEPMAKWGHPLQFWKHYHKKSLKNEWYNPSVDNENITELLNEYYEDLETLPA